MATISVETLADHIEVGDCWEWKGSQGRTGYGRAWFRGRRGYAHRVVYEMLVGPIPEGMQLNHLCFVRHCVNPDHLEPVTPAENIRRSWPARVRQCPAGHAYDRANTLVDPKSGARFCRECSRIRKRVSYRTRKAGDAA